MCKIATNHLMNVEEFLKSHDIKYVLHEHPAVYTCEEAEKYCDDIPGIACKNLFLRDKKGKHYFLVILPAEKQIDLKKFAELIGSKRLSFASSESLKEKLGIETGAVSPFGLLNDKKREVELYVDSKVRHANTVSFHPNVNTATIELSNDMFCKFLQAIEHKTNIIDL